MANSREEKLAKQLRINLLRRKQAVIDKKQDNSHQQTKEIKIHDTGEKNENNK